MSWKLHQGHVLDVLATLPAESCQMACTSPPYWGLRAYGTEAQVWGGDPACAHRWGEPRLPGNYNWGDTIVANGHIDHGHQKSAAAIRSTDCTDCGAWRGELGSEPTIELFIAHLVEVFRVVRRVLRKDGTVFLNISDSYFGSGCGPTGQNGIGDQSVRQGFVGTRRDAAYGTDGTEQFGLKVPDSAYRDLCDGCLADFQSHRVRTVGTGQPQPQSELLPVMTGHGSGRQDDGLGGLGAGLRVAQESTTLESWLQSRGECSRCASRGVLSQSLRPASADGALEYADTGAYTNGNALPASSFRNRDKGVSHSAWGYSTTASLKPKDLCLIPFRLALALQADGWWVRSDIVWSKPNPMPESVTDRPTRAHEYVFLLSKSRTYYYNADAIRELPCTTPAAADSKWASRRDGTAKGGQDGIWHGGGHPFVNGPNPLGANARSVWTIATQGFPGAHYATFPVELPRRCILAGSREGDTVLDPFAGAATTLLVADRLGRHGVGIELNSEYVKLAERRLYDDAPLFAEQ